MGSLVSRVCSVLFFTGSFLGYWLQYKTIQKKRNAEGFSVFVSLLLLLSNLLQCFLLLGNNLSFSYSSRFASSSSFTSSSTFFQPEPFFSSSVFKFLRPIAMITVQLCILKLCIRYRRKDFFLSAERASNRSSPSSSSSTSSSSSSFPLHSETPTPSEQSSFLSSSPSSPSPSLLLQRRSAFDTLSSSSSSSSSLFDYEEKKGLKFGGGLRQLSVSKTWAWIRFNFNRLREVEEGLKSFWDWDSFHSYGLYFLPSFLLLVLLLFFHANLSFL
jgi:hypothetical protein